MFFNLLKRWRQATEKQYAKRQKFRVLGCVCVCPFVYDLNVTHELFNEMIFYYYDCRTAYADCV